MIVLGGQDKIPFKFVSHPKQMVEGILIHFAKVFEANMILGTPKHILITGLWNKSVLVSNKSVRGQNSLHILVLILLLFILFYFPL